MEINVVEHQLPLKLKDGNYHMYPTKINMVFAKDGTTPIVDKATGQWTADNALRLNGVNASEYVQKTDQMFQASNILLNSNWLNPINYNGAQSVFGVNDIECITGWRSASTACSASVTASGIVFHKNNAYNILYQRFPLGNFAGKTITMACCDNNDNITVGHAVFPQSGNACTVAINNLTNISMSFDARYGYDYFRIGLTDAALEDVTVKWVAAYPGIFTAETLPIYIPPNPREELIKLGVPTCPNNLLYNSDFLNPINTQGNKQYTFISNPTYTIDNWILWNANYTVDIVDGGIRYSNVLAQNLDIPKFKNNKAYTIACGLANGTVFCFSGIADETGLTGIGDWNIIRLYYSTSNSAWYFAFYDGLAGQTISWAAIYEGVYGIDTLPEYQSPELRIEMMRQYFATQPVNLLDNSNFANWIAQAGFVNTHGTTWYAADRWILSGYNKSANRTITISQLSNSARLVSTYQYICIQQKVTNVAGKTLTFAMKALRRQVIAMRVYDENDNILAGMPFGGNGTLVNAITVTVPSNVNTIICRIYPGFAEDGGTAEIYWTALYEGSYAVETLPFYVPRSYTVELEECRRYYRQSYVGSTPSSAGAVPLHIVATVPSVPAVNWDTPMRAVPDVTIKSWGDIGDNAVRSWSESKDVAIAGATYVGVNGFSLNTRDSALEPDKNYAYHYTAYADL